MYVFDAQVGQRQHDNKYFVEILVILEEEFARAYYNKHKFLPAFCPPRWVVYQVFDGYKPAKKCAQEWRSKLWRGAHAFSVPTTAGTTAT